MSNLNSRVRIISIDPGRTTGYTYCILNTDSKVLAYYPFQAIDDVDDLWARLEAFKPDHIVMENFEFRQKARAGLDMFPVQLIGIARFYELHKGTTVRLYLQSAFEGKGYYTDTILKRKALYVKAIPHGMDASRHLLHWIMFKAGGQFGVKEPFVLLDKWV